MLQPTNRALNSVGSNYLLAKQLLVETPLHQRRHISGRVPIDGEKAKSVTFG
jgi:hypothetical protein